MRWCIDPLVDTVLVVDGLIQVTGATLLAVGLASTRKSLIRDDKAAWPAVTWIGPTSFAAHGLGLTVGGAL